MVRITVQKLACAAIALYDAATGRYRGLPVNIRMQ